MKKEIRRIFFYFFMVVFLIVAPVLIAHSLGYKFDFSKGSFEETGGIFVKSGMSRLSIFLNGAFVTETSIISGGALLTDLKTGSSLLRVEKGGFLPWSKTVEVKPQIVTELRNILLVPRTLLMATSSSEEIKMFSALLLSPEYELDKTGGLIKKGGGTKNILVSNVHSFQVWNEQIIFVDKNGFLARLDPTTKNVKIISRPGFYLTKEPLKFIASTGLMVLIDSGGGLFLLNTSMDELFIIGGGIFNASFDEKEEKLVLLKDQGVEILWLSDNPRQPFQKKNTREEILKIDSAPQEVRWFYGDNAHLIVRFKEGVFLTELDGRGGRNTFELVSGKTDGVMTMARLPNSVFIKKDKIWYKIEL